MYEHADDPRAYRRERAEHEHARAVVELLLRATGAWGRLGVEQSEAARAREMSLEHFAQLVREARRPDRLFPCPDWAPSPRLLRAIEQRGLTLAEVEERARA